MSLLIGVSCCFFVVCGCSLMCVVVWFGLLLFVAVRC